MALNRIFSLSVLQAGLESRSVFHLPFLPFHFPHSRRMISSGFVQSSLPDPPVLPLMRDPAEGAPGRRQGCAFHRPVRHVCFWMAKEFVRRVSPEDAIFSFRIK
jgi:hypothetical protein